MEDMERVIAAMRRVVERLQGENEQLKKNVGAGGPQYNDLMRENKKLKVCDSNGGPQYNDLMRENKSDL